MIHRLALLLAAVVVLAGCRAREITKLERDEAANVVSEAEFALTMKDWPRAEGLYAKAAALTPDQGETWVRLGVVRVRMNNPGGAKDAYKSALAAFKDDYDKHPERTGSVIREATVLVILGRADEARRVVDKAYARSPDDRRLRSFVEMKGVDKIIADPGLKEITP
jgi:tetratricopeptide (TPR) repeat protein